MKYNFETFQILPDSWWQQKGAAVEDNLSDLGIGKPGENYKLEQLKINVQILTHIKDFRPDQQLWHSGVGQVCFERESWDETTDIVHF